MSAAPSCVLAFGGLLAAALFGPRGVAQTPPARAPLPGAAAGPVAFVDVTVVPMDSERLLIGHTVVVKDGRIVAVGPANRVQIPTEAMRIDGRGQYLIPGLADMHLHVQRSDGERLLLRLLARGVTTIRNMDYAEEGRATLALRARAAAGELLSPRIYTAGAWMTKQDYVSLNQNIGTAWRIAPAEVATRIAAYKAAGYDFVKPYFESPEIFDSVVTAARRLGLPVAGHVPFLVSIKQALAARMQSIEHLTGYLNHLEMSGGTGGVSAVLANLKDTAQRTALVEATRRAGTWNCPTLAAMEQAVELIPTAGAPSPLMLEMRRFVRDLQDAGAGLLLGTDAENIVNVADELKALTRAGLTPYQALVTGTRNPAAYFGTLDSTGTIELGKRADLVLLDRNPLQDVRYVTNPAGTMLGGQWLSRAEFDRRLNRRRAATSSSPAPAP